MNFEIMSLRKINFDIILYSVLFAAFSVLMSAFFFFFLLPSLLKSRKEKVNSRVIKSTIFDRIAAYSFERNRYLIVTIALLSILFFFTSKKISFNSTDTIYRLVCP